jgi:hypothetical protein
MEVPSKDDWEEARTGLDQAHAFRNFFGKSLEDAHKLFVQCALSYQEDLVYMPEKPFRYYVRAYIHYMQSEKSRGDSDAANCFLGLVETRLRDHPEWLEANWNQIDPILNRIANQQEEFYDASPSIYGDFAKKVSRLIENRTKAQQNAAGQPATRSESK